MPREIPDDAARELLIGGRWAPAADGSRFVLEDPSTGAALTDVASAGAADVDRAVAAARAALSGAWGRASAADRGRVLGRIAGRIADASESLARLEAMDVGKPLSQARADAKALARYFEFYAGAADKLHGETIPYREGYAVLTWREPLGATGHVIPWNYPMQIIGRSVGAALAAGNAAVVKPSEEAALSALAFARIAEEAGLPAGALNVVPGLGGVAGAALVAHPGVDRVSFTGSFEVGAEVQRAAAARAAPVTLELGGKSPQIVFADADLARAIPSILNSGIQNAGQTCSAASRVLVQKAAYARVRAALAERYRSLTAAPALDDLDLGPLISRSRKARVERLFADSRQAGARVVAEGRIARNAPASGHYLAPSLFEDAAPDGALANEEIFGPAQVLIPFEAEEDAVRIANATGYGLVAGVWTTDGSRALRMARALRAGQVFINNYGAGGGVELPFGGVGRSGHGREKGMEALYGFTALKTIAIDHR